MADRASLRQLRNLPALAARIMSGEAVGAVSLEIVGPDPNGRTNGLGYEGGIEIMGTDGQIAALPWGDESWDILANGTIARK